MFAAFDIYFVEKIIQSEERGFFMPGFKLTETQRQRLRELGADMDLEQTVFGSIDERDCSFRAMEQEMARKEKNHLDWLLVNNLRPAICRIEDILVNKLNGEGFVQVFTPVIISRGFLNKMSIPKDHLLAQQVFWIDKNKCLRPMLAPNLYYLLKQLVRLWKKPVRIFEVGPCFRKDTKGSQHLNEFTMLNLVELGTPMDKRHERIEELAGILMEAAGIKNYELVSNTSEIYGQTIDVVTGIELCSAAMGPHPLDAAWGIIDPWVGLGFGLERIVMEIMGYQNIQRAGRSLIYLDGARLNI